MTNKKHTFRCAFFIAFFCMFFPRFVKQSDRLIGGKYLAINQVHDFQLRVVEFLRRGRARIFYANDLEAVVR